MRRTESIRKIDNHLCNYVQHNSNKYKRNIKSVYMNRNQVKKFYHDMMDNFQQKIAKTPNQKLKKRSHHTKARAKSIIDQQRNVINWEKPKIIEMDTRTLNYNKKQSTSLWLKSTNSDYDKLKNKGVISKQNKQNLKTQIQDLKTFQEQKYIKKAKKIKDKHIFRRYQKQKQKSKMNIQRKQAMSPKNDHKIKMLIWHTFDKRTDAQKRIGRKEVNAVKSEFKVKQQLFDQIKTYFIKKNRYCPAF